MKLFEVLKSEKELKRYLRSKYGTMYFEPSSDPENSVIIRSLDATITPDLFSYYLDIYKCIKESLKSNMYLKEHIRVAEILEVGKDYFIRPFFTYDLALDDYFDQEEPVEVPKQYYEIKKELQFFLRSFKSEKEKILNRVLENSFLKSTGKTFYDSRTNEFIIVELKILYEDIKEWKDL